MKKQLATLLAVTALGIGVLSGCGVSAASNSTGSSSDSAGAIEITNVSYDPTRELYAAYNDLFAKHWKEEKGQDVSVVQSHGGSGKQALEVANGLQADVLLAWENEAFLSLDEHPGEYEIVVPSVSILCQPTVSVVDEVVDKRGTRDVATEYLNYLYSDEAQKLEAEWYYRPSDQDILKQFEYQGQSGDPPVLSGGILSQTVTIRILADHHQTESSVQLRSEVNTSHLEGRSHHGGGQHNFRTLCRVAHNQIHLPGQKDHINAHRSAAYHIPDHRGPYIRTYIWQAELPVSIP